MKQQIMSLNISCINAKGKVMYFTFQISYAVSIAILKRPRIDLIDYSVLPPIQLS